MREIKLIVVHCAATPASMNIGAKEINQWHIQRGFNGIGYHKVIRRSGAIENGRPLAAIGAHAKGYNSNSIGICMVGGVEMVAGKPVPKNNFAPEQFATLEKLLREMLVMFPKAKIIGHRDVEPNKACPSFSVQDFLKAKNFPAGSY